MDQCGKRYPLMLALALLIAACEYYIQWNNLNTVIPAINSGFGGFSRAAVAFKIDLGGDRSSYNPDDDEITFGQSYPYRTVGGHEYTHALQHKALGGTWRDGFMGIRNCWGHETDKASSYKCGLREGLADYGGRVGVNDASYWEHKHYDPPSGRGAGEIEGNVAALFRDLIDSNNEGGDNTTYGAKFVLTVFKTCVSRTNSVTTPETSFGAWRIGSTKVFTTTTSPTSRHHPAFGTRRPRWSPTITMPMMFETLGSGTSDEGRRGSARHSGSDPAARPERLQRARRLRP